MDIRKIEENNMNHFIPINLTTSRGKYKFIEKHKLPKLTHEEIENSNVSIF